MTGLSPGDKIVNTIPIFSSPISHVEDHDEVIGLGVKNFGRVEFRKEDYQNSSFDITYRWSFIGDFQNKLADGTGGVEVSDDDSQFIPALQYYKNSTSSWQTLSDYWPPLTFNNLDNHSLMN